MYFPNKVNLLLCYFYCYLKDSILNVYTVLQRNSNAYCFPIFYDVRVST